MTLEDIWRRKSDETLLVAAHQLNEYTEASQRAIVAELRHRREAGLISGSSPLDEASGVYQSTGTSHGPVDVSPGLLRRLWRGEASLLVTYWLWGAVANLVWLILIAFSIASERPALVLFLLAFHLLYYVFITVAIWRSAGRYTGRAIWGDLARVSLALGLLRTVGTWFARP